SATRRRPHRPESAGWRDRLASIGGKTRSEPCGLGAELCLELGDLLAHQIGPLLIRVELNRFAQTPQAFSDAQAKLWISARELERLPEFLERGLEPLHVRQYSSVVHVKWSALRPPLHRQTRFGLR